MVELMIFVSGEDGWIAATFLKFFESADVSIKDSVGLNAVLQTLQVLL